MHAHFVLLLQVLSYVKKGSVPASDVKEWVKTTVSIVLYSLGLQAE